MRKLLLLTVAILLTSSSALSAQALADRVPADAIVYVGWKGSDTPGTGYEGSHLQAVMKEANFKAVVDDVIPQVINKIGQGDQHGLTWFKTVTLIAGPLWRHPTAIFVQPVGDAGAPAPVPLRAGVLCQAGTESKALVEQLNGVLAQAGAEAQQYVQVSESGDLVVVIIGMPSPNAGPVAPGGESLAKDSTFTTTLKQVVADPFVMGYVNVEGGLSIVDRAVAEQGGEQAGQIWSKFREASGFDGLKRIAAGGRFQGKDWSAASFVEAPAPRKGLVAVFDTKSLGPEVMAMIPATAATAQATRFDPAAFLKELRNVAAAIDPNAAQGFDQGMGMVQMTIGRNLITDVLEPLGDTWVLYSDEKLAGNKLEGIVLVNKLDDATKAQQGLNSVWLAASNMISGMTRQGQRRGAQPQGQQQQQGPVTFSQEKVGNLTVSFVQTPLHGLGWAINEGKLIAGFSKDGIGKTATAPAPSPGFEQNAKFAALKKQLAGGEVTAFKFLDLPQTAPVMYEQFTQGLAQLRGLAQQQGINLPEKLLPSLETIKAHVAPAASMSWTDASGFHSKSFKPFPGSDALSNSPTGPLSQLGSAAGAVGVMLPALGRSRETANRVKCASNQRMIGQAILLYSNENKGKYPPDLGTLILTQDITLDVFICPSSGTAPPPNRRNMTPQQVADWVNQNSDYVYAGQGLTNNAPADRAVLYEKPNAHRNAGMNMLFGDGHVEFHMRQMADQIIQGLKTKPAGP